MNELEFLILAINQWPTLAALTAALAALLWIIVRRVVVGGIFDPLVLALVLGYSVNYAVVGLLLLQGLVTPFLATMVFGYGVTLLTVFAWASRRRRPSAFGAAVAALTPGSIGPAAFRVSVALYALLSLYLTASIGLGIFAETNRFDAARGFGAFIRVLDLLSPFIVAYATLSIWRSRRRRRLKAILLAAFIVYAAMVNGAKIGVIFSLVTAFFTLRMATGALRIRPAYAAATLMGGLAFSVLALVINLQSNNIDITQGNTELARGGVVFERFVFRLIASGDTSYLLLPDGVIDRIATDSVWVRFAAPLLGTGTLGNMLQYPVVDYSVGRQALLYHDPGYDIFGGPTSHFDFFAYVYFGLVGGWLFVIGLGLALGSINRAVRRVSRHIGKAPIGHFRIAVLATIWTRAVLAILEPALALAYVIDALVYFGLLSVVLLALRRSPRARPPVPSPTVA